MNQTLRRHADQIIRGAIAAVQPDAAVQRALAEMRFPGRVLLVAAGKAAWQMAKAASDCLGSRIENGVVITKYDHVMGPIANFACFEAGHPVPDENSFRGTQAALDLVSDLAEKDTVLFLLSGGGSALFEKPLVPAEELRDITGQLLASGADIVEINTIRKRLSAVKGGRFAQWCRPAHVEAVVLSDILGDPLDMIASGPACPDTATAEDAWRIQKKYGIKMSEAALKLLDAETPKSLDNVHTQINGSVRELCRAAARECEHLGYEPVLLTDQMCCQAKEAGSFLASVIKTHIRDGKPLAFIAGGETVVKLTGHGLGGRNQEIALAAAAGISGFRNAAVFSVGSDGTDGPTDAAGGYADGDTCRELADHGLSIDAVLRENDAYHALQKTGGLIMTGPTGTNVNDVAVALLGTNEEAVEK
ncbi:MAG: glycerate kinase [Clostridia bacterium]|nr:glycerate kinase [Clostridia bacterium]